jgi:hypothetical protein
MPDNENESRGLQALRQRLKDLQRERASARADREDFRPGEKITGERSLEQQINTTRRAIKRQEQYSRGEYPSGE